MKRQEKIIIVSIITLCLSFFITELGYGQVCPPPSECFTDSNCPDYAAPPPLTQCCQLNWCWRWDGDILNQYAWKTCEQEGCRCDPSRYCAGGYSCCSGSDKDCICNTPECPGCMSDETCLFVPNVNGYRCYKKIDCECSSAIMGEEAKQYKPVLIKFGEAMMTRSKVGKDFEKNYVKYKEEMIQIFLNDEELRIQARGFIQRYIEIFREVAENNITQGTLNRVFTPGDAKTLKIFISRIRDQASPEYREFLLGLSPYIDQFEGKRFGEILEFLGLL